MEMDVESNATGVHQEDPKGTTDGPSIIETSQSVIAGKEDAIPVQQDENNKQPTSDPESAQTGVVETSARPYTTRSTTKLSESNVVVHPRLKPVLFKVELKPLKVPSMVSTGVVSGINFYNTEEQPLNKRGYKYKCCERQEQFTSNLYWTSELPPYNVHCSYFDRAAGIQFSEDMSEVTTAHGWRSVRSNIGIREGCYYFEFNIINANDEGTRSHVRVGIARKEASLEAPVGLDGYGYGIRDVSGQKVTLLRPKEFLKHIPPNSTMPGFKSGDVIGFLVELPSLKQQRQFLDEWFKNHSDANQAPEKKRKKSTNTTRSSQVLRENGNVFRDQVPIKYKNLLYYEQFEYTPTKRMNHLLNPVTVFGESAILENSDVDRSMVPLLKGSKIDVFQNGQRLGTAFEDLFAFLPNDDDLVAQLLNPDYRHTDDGQLGYYPMILVYQHGIVGFNAGPDFKYPVAEAAHAKPLSLRYSEAVIEEYLWDVIDEVEAQFLDSFEQ